MIRWCFSCQSFIGEKAPYEDYSVTHGICTNCKNLGSQARTQIQKNKIAIKQFFDTVFGKAATGKAMDPNDLIYQGKSLGITNRDLLLGIIKPSLWKIGQLYQEGSISVYHEHLYSEFCLSLLDEISNKNFQTSENCDVLLTAAEGNYHFIGIRLLKLLLEDRGIKVKAVYPGLPHKEIPLLQQQYKAKILGVSVSSEAELPTLQEICQKMKALDQAPIIVLGGSCHKFVKSSIKWADFTADPYNSEDAIEFITQAIFDKLSGKKVA